MQKLLSWFILLTVLCGLTSAALAESAPAPGAAMVAVVEEEFETEIPDEEAEKITTVQQAADYIQSHLKA